MENMPRWGSRFCESSEEEKEKGGIKGHERIWGLGLVEGK